MSRFKIIFKSIGPSASLIEWPHQVNEDILEDILALQSKIEAELESDIVETVSAYNSLTVIHKEGIAATAALEEKIKIIYQSLTKPSKKAKITWKIPVCYDEEFGIDLKEIASLKNCTTKEIISAHCSSEYLVYFTGFLPGFLYLGGLPESLHVARKSTPRLRIKKGAVAIGGQQTGIYPVESPGGWNIIGNSPLRFFDPMHTPPCFAKAGDHLQFYSIERNEHEQLLKAVEQGTFKINCETQ